MALNSAHMFTPDVGSAAAKREKIEKGSDSPKGHKGPMPFEKPQASWVQDALVDTLEVMGKHVEERLTKVDAQVDDDDGAGIELLKTAATSTQKECAEVEKIAHSGSHPNVQQLGSELASVKAEQAKFKASFTVGSTPSTPGIGSLVLNTALKASATSGSTTSTPSIGSLAWNTAPTLLESLDTRASASDVLKDGSIDALQKSDPHNASTSSTPSTGSLAWNSASTLLESPAGGVTSVTWKQSTGRMHGGDGYELGDLTRGWVYRASKKLQERFGISQQISQQKSDAVRGALRVPASMDSNSHMPRSIHSVQDKGAIRQKIVVRMVASRKTAKRLLEKSLPLLELRLQELNAGHALNTQDRYDLYRIHGGNLLSLDPLQKYRMCLENVCSHCDIVFDTKFVRGAQKKGVLQEFLELLDDNMLLAEKCANCVNEVCDGVAIIF